MIQSFDLRTRLSLIFGLFFLLAPTLVLAAKTAAPVYFADYAAANYVYAAAFSADRTRFFTRVKKGEGKKGNTKWELALWDPNTEGTLQVAKMKLEALSFALSPDGSRVASGRVSWKKQKISVRMINWKGREKKKISFAFSALDPFQMYEDGQRMMRRVQMDFSPDGKHIAVIHNKNYGRNPPDNGWQQSIQEDQLSIFDVSTGKRIARTEVRDVGGFLGTTFAWHSPHYSPSGEYLMLGTHIFVVEKRRGVAGSLTSDRAFISNWIVEAESLATVNDFGASRYEGAKSGSDLEALDDNLSRYSEIDISPDGTRVAASNYRSAAVFEIYNPAPVAESKMEIKGSSAVLWGDDRHFIVVNNGRAKIFGAAGKDLYYLDFGLYQGTMRALSYDRRNKEWVIVTNADVFRLSLPSTNKLSTRTLWTKAAKLAHAGFGENARQEILNAVTTDLAGVDRNFLMLELLALGDKGDAVFTPAFAGEYARAIWAQVGTKNYPLGFAAYGFMGLKAGHTGIARQVASGLRRDWPENTELMSYIYAAATLLEAGAMAQEGSVDEAYALLLERFGPEPETIADNVFRMTPNALRSLMKDPKKLAFVLGSDDLPPGKSGITPGPYPDFEGNMIQPAGAVPATLLGVAPVRDKPTASRAPSPGKKKKKKATVLD